MDPASRPPLGALALVGQSFRVLFAHFGFLFPLAFLPALTLAILSWIADPTAPAMEPGVGPGMMEGPMMVSGGAAALVLFAFLVNVLVGFAVTGVMCLAALDAILGKRHSVGEYVAQTLRHIVPIVLLGALLYVVAGLAFALLVVPGLYVLARFLPWVPAIVFENAGWSGLTRGQELTEGYRWPIAGAMLLFGLLGIGLALLVAPVAVAAGALSPLVLVLVEAVATAVCYALSAVFTALVYARLREIGEGVSVADIAATID
jgi:hypothetical protein